MTKNPERPENARTRYDRKKPPLGVRLAVIYTDMLEDLSRAEGVRKGVLLERWIDQNKGDFRGDVSESRLNGQREGDEAYYNEVFPTVPCGRCRVLIPICADSEVSVRRSLSDGTGIRHGECPP